VKRWLFVVIGVLLALAGTLWTLQGLNLLGQSGGMNGQRLWAVVGPLTAVGGLVLIMIGARSGRSPRSRTGSH
jgi:hypothetical protein